MTKKQALSDNLEFPSNLLDEMARALDEAPDFATGAGKALALLAQHIRASRYGLGLLDDRSGKSRFIVDRRLTDRDKSASANAADAPVRADGIVWRPLRAGGRVAGILILEDVPGADGPLAVAAALLLAQALRLDTALRREKEELIEENFQLREELKARFRFENLVGTGGRMQEVVDTAALVARSNATVLLSGETGTGKELLAHAIHYTSARANAPFVRINCGALAESLLESELFGHVKGAFTGAERDRKGRFELAHRGTLFLDEIGEMSPRLQVKLLRVLQEKEYERVGEGSPRPADVRIITATNKNLEEEIRERRFREDLYYRLNVVSIRLPALRERTEDIPLLVEHFLAKYNRENARDISRIPPDILDLFRRYPWPGNVRELENCIERAVVMSPGNELAFSALPVSLRSLAEGPSGPAAGGTLEETLRQFLAAESGNVAADAPGRLLEKTEAALIRIALRDNHNIRREAAKALGMNRNTLRAKMKAHGISAGERGNRSTG
ncbi:MAG: sigma 54-interacting transcriptional regulator [Planctomycetota bacterium]